MLEPEGINAYKIKKWRDAVNKLELTSPSFFVLFSFSRS